MNNPFVDYTIAADAEPPPVTNKMFEYVMAKDGLYIRGKRPGLEICSHIGPSCVELKGLAELQSYVRFDYPRVPARLLFMMLQLSRAAQDKKGRPIEKLFHLTRHDFTPADDRDGWRVVAPAQEATSGSVRPLQTGAGSSTEDAVVELHSHHNMRAFFSTQDDLDESQGFRIYAVIGEIFERPAIRVRIGMFGHFFPIPAETVFELPATFEDASLREIHERAARFRKRAHA